MWEVLVYDIKESICTTIGKTSAVNRQQGSRLKWAYNNAETFYYNDYIDSHYVCVRARVDDGTKEIIGPAFYDLNDKHGIGLALNFERLGVTRAGYGYKSTLYINQSDDELLEEGIVAYKLGRFTPDTLVTYRKLIDISGWDKSNIQRFYINHISLNPSGDKFIFFWLDRMDSDANMKASMFVYDLVNRKLCMLENEYKVSHYAWKNDSEILVTILDGNHNCSYVIYNVDSGVKHTIQIDGLFVDGHPSWIDQRYFITDTYPNRLGYQTLFLVNSETGEKETMVEMYHTAYCTGEMRCDMHPRLNNSKTLIAFDGNMHGKRNVYMLNLKALI